MVEILTAVMLLIRRGKTSKNRNFLLRPSQTQKVRSYFLLELAYGKDIEENKIKKKYLK